MTQRVAGRFTRSVIKAMCPIHGFSLGHAPTPSAVSLCILHHCANCSFPRIRRTPDHTSCPSHLIRELRSHTKAKNKGARAAKTKGARVVTKKKAKRMNPNEKALCYAYRNLPKGTKKMSYNDIAKIVGVKEGSVRECVATFLDDKAKRGRKKGWRKTTKAEDRVIMTKFHKVSPPYVMVAS